MEATKLPTIGLALSGSGNRTPFYIGFLEVLAEAQIKIDYIAACSGGSLVAAAYACGTLAEFKKTVFALDREALKKYFVRSQAKGGFFSLGYLENEVLKYTKGLSFEEARPLMGFVAVDIETGEKVFLSMGDIARAAVISCILPGIFEPVQWGGKTLVDGGLLTMVPVDFLRQANTDITIGVNMRGTKHIFTEGQITVKKVYNFLKKILFVDEINSLLDNLFQVEAAESGDTLGFFQVIGKSLDLAIKANKVDDQKEEMCDINILPSIPKLKQKQFSQESIKYFYQMGRDCAQEYLPEIEKLIKSKSH